MRMRMRMLGWWRKRPALTFEYKGAALEGWMRNDAMRIYWIAFPEQGQYCSYYCREQE